MPSQITSDPVTLNAFTDHSDPALYDFLMQVARAYDLTVEQMDDLSESGHVQVRFHAFANDTNDDMSRVAALVNAISNPVDLNDSAALLAAMRDAAPTDSPIIAQARDRQEAANSDTPPNALSPSALSDPSPDVPSLDAS